MRNYEYYCAPDWSFATVGYDSNQYTQVRCGLRPVSEVLACYLYREQSIQGKKDLKI